MTKRIVCAVLTVAMLLSLLAAPTFAATLKSGSSGTAVRYLQMQLNFLGYNVGKADGCFGAKTKTAVLAYQADHGLSRDGVAGSKTNASLDAEVAEIQTMLSALGYAAGTADGIPGTKTTRALRSFESDSGLSADGIADKTAVNALRNAYNDHLDELEEELSEFTDAAADSWTLPLKDDFKSVTGSRKFGASRENGKRAHAGIDFVAPVGTPVYAMTDGKVSLVYPFYEGTYAVEVKNTDGSVLLYGEISPAVKKGESVSQGQLIGYIMESDDHTIMLHLELYRGTSGGALTQKSNKTYDYLPGGSLKYGRRADLLDPTFLLKCDKPA